MKLKIFVSFVFFVLQGCSSYYDKKYNQDNLDKKIDNLIKVDSAKRKSFSRYDTSFLGKEVSYNESQKIFLDKTININSDSLVSLNEVFDIIYSQTGVTYKYLDARANNQNIDSEEEVKNIKNKIQFSGNFHDFIDYISTIYDVALELDKSNILLVNYYKNYHINLDFFGQNNKYATGLDVSSNQGAASSGFSGNSQVTFESSFWSDIETLVSNNLSSGVFSLMKDTSAVTFLGKHSEYLAIKKAISDYQNSNSKQFVVNYKIYIVDI